MNDEEQRQNNLIDTTDCLEAVGVFRGWKNFLFIITILCVLILQVSFWLVNTACIKTEEKNTKSCNVVQESTKQTEVKQLSTIDVPDQQDEIEKAAKKVAAEANEPTKPAEAKEIVNGAFWKKITFKHLAWLIRFINFVLIPTAVLYCLTMLFSLKVSLLGRLGGINHISRAFFISLVMLVLLLPWQKFFSGVVAGAMYTPSELLKAYSAAENRDIFGTFFYYLRFVGYWLLIFLLLVFSQIRSSRWAKAILRRLEVI